MMMHLCDAPAPDGPFHSDGFKMRTHTRLESLSLCFSALVQLHNLNGTYLFSLFVSGGNNS
jgi:hypothetical protein